MPRGKEVRIELIHEHASDAWGTKFLVAAQRRLEERGVEFVAGNLPRAIEGAPPKCICDALDDCFEGPRQSVARDRSGRVTARPRKGGRRSRRRFMRRTLSGRAQALLHHRGDDCRCRGGLRAHVTGRCFGTRIAQRGPDEQARSAPFGQEEGLAARWHATRLRIAWWPTRTAHATAASDHPSTGCTGVSSFN